MPPYSTTPRGTLLLGVALALGAMTLAVGTALGPTVPVSATRPAQPIAGNGPGGGNDGRGVGNGADGAAAPAKALIVTPTVLGAVRPGTPAQLRVRVDNPNSQDVHLRSVSASVEQVTSGPGATPACQAGDFTISGFAAPAGTRRVLKGGTTTVDLVITLRDTTANQDRCKGATYGVDVRATADQA
jgi:hypothetical protein